MSAYIVDPRTIDYLVAWAHRQGTLLQTRRLWRRFKDVPSPLQYAVDGQEPEHMPPGLESWAGYSLILCRVSPNDLGQILLTENVRSVRARYPHDSADTLPGPADQKRVWRYEFRPILQELRPDWVISSCDCLSYQSCETGDWENTVAYAIVHAIREDAILEMIDGAPWGVTEADLAKV